MEKRIKSIRWGNIIIYKINILKELKDRGWSWIKKCERFKSFDWVGNLKNKNLELNYMRDENMSRKR